MLHLELVYRELLAQEQLEGHSSTITRVSGLSPEKKSRVVKMCVLSSSSHVEPQSCDYRMLQLSIVHAQIFRLIPLEQAVDPK